MPHGQYQKHFFIEQTMKVDALMMTYGRAQNADIQTVLDGFFGQLPGAAFLQGDLSG
jgi:hypothetical protein